MNKPMYSLPKCPVDSGTAQRILNEYRAWYKEQNFINRTLLTPQKLQEYIGDLPPSLLEMKVKDIVSLFKWFIDVGYLK